MPRAGDTVFHRPSGESWVVAYADPERDELSWVGWPPGVAKLTPTAISRSASVQTSSTMLDATRAMRGMRDDPRLWEGLAKNLRTRRAGRAAHQSHELNAHHEKSKGRPHAGGGTAYRWGVHSRRS